MGDDHRIWTPTLRAAALLALVAPAAAAAAGEPACPPAAAALRLRGLERLYFERIEGPVVRHESIARFGKVMGARLAGLVPEKLAAPVVEASTPSGEESAFELGVEDFPLPGDWGGHKMVLREASSLAGRMTDQWWVLYEDGCRVDGWFFTPTSQRTENKLLTEVSLRRVASGPSGRLSFDVAGDMVRPAGAWWTMKATLVFAIAADGLRFERVEGYHQYFRGYDHGDGRPIDHDVTAERPVQRDGRWQVEVRRGSTLNPAQDARCKPPPDDPDPNGEAEAWEKCLLDRPEIEYRALDAPTFMERGGRAPSR